MTGVWRFYERFAREWDRDRRKPSQGLMEGRYLDDVTSRLKPGAEILDLGCGSGEPMARYLTESGFSVTGVDAAPAMIAICNPIKHLFILIDLRKNPQPPQQSDHSAR